MTGRSGTSNRKRRYQIGVRLNPAEMALLKAACARSGLSAAAQLRRAFLVAYQDTPVAVCGCGAAIWAGKTHTCGDDLPVTAAGWMP